VLSRVVEARRAFPCRPVPSASRRARTANSSPSPRGKAGRRTSRATRLDHRSHHGPRAEPRAPGAAGCTRSCRKDDPTARRGRHGLRKPMDGRSSSRISARTTCHVDLDLALRTDRARSRAHPVVRPPEPTASSAPGTQWARAVTSDGRYAVVWRAQYGIPRPASGTDGCRSSCARRSSPGDRCWQRIRTVLTILKTDRIVKQKAGSPGRFDHRETPERRAGGAQRPSRPWKPPRRWSGSAPWRGLNFV